MFKERWIQWSSVIVLALTGLACESASVTYVDYDRPRARRVAVVEQPPDVVVVEQPRAVRVRRGYYWDGHRYVREPRGHDRDRHRGSYRDRDHDHRRDGRHHHDDD